MSNDFTHIKLPDRLRSMRRFLDDLVYLHSGTYALGEIEELLLELRRSLHEEAVAISQVAENPPPYFSGGNTNSQAVLNWAIDEFIVIFDKIGGIQQAPFEDNSDDVADLEAQWARLRAFVDKSVAMLSRRPS